MVLTFNVKTMNLVFCYEVLIGDKYFSWMLLHS